MSDLETIRQVLESDELGHLQSLVESTPGLIHQEFEKGWRNKTSLLLMALEYNRPKAVIYLLEQGANPMAQPQSVLVAWINAVCRHGMDEHVFESLARHGLRFPMDDTPECARFLESYLNPVYHSDNVPVFQALVELGLDPVAIEQACNDSFISKALNDGYYQSKANLARWLLDQGCRLAVEGKPKKEPLLHAIQRGHYDFARLLMEKGASIKSVASELLDFLIYPYRKVPEDIVEAMLDSKPDFNTQVHNEYPLHMAARAKNVDFLVLAVKHGANIEIINLQGYTPLITAIKSDAKNYVKKLVDLGADVNATDEKGDTALDIAQSLPGFKVVCTKLVKAGAKSRLMSSESGEEAPNPMDVIKKSIEPGEPWAERAHATIAGLSDEQIALWNRLVRHCLDNNSAKPSKKWLKEANAMVDAIGSDLVRTQLLDWFPLVKEKRTQVEERPDDYCYDYEEYYSRRQPHSISESNTRLLRALAWVASRYNDGEMSRALRELAAAMYKKVYGVGMRNAKIGNAAILSLSLIPGNVGIKEIIILRAATKYNPALVNINRVFDKLAEAKGMSADELAELAIPDYGLTDIGVFQQTMGEFIAQLRLVATGKTELTWKNTTTDKVQKSVPAALKEPHKDDIKAIKNLAKDIQTGSSAHSLRLEQMYLRDKTVDMAAWKEQYIDHKLIGFLARRLIWQVQSNNQTVNVIYTPSGFVDCSNSPVAALDDNATVRLWHPTQSDVDEVLSWRRFLIEHELAQPFKQAHREIYLLTDAERNTETYSMRFANHILKQTQFHALATQRGWSQTRGGGWDGGQENSAYKSIPAFDVSVEFDATGAEGYGYSDTGMYECVASSQVVFRNRLGAIKLEKLNPLLFSEVMRDADLFVGVASIGNDPDWRDRENPYWVNSSFGELNALAQTRRDVLAMLIPKLKIAPKLTLEGKFLIVEGSVRTYKIHLGSSNILMAPNDSYLCIVETAKAGSDVMLPFEGDRTLSLILSKAQLLANDHKIKDATILSQINHRGAA